MNFCVKNWTHGNFRTCVLCAIVSLNLTTALHRYFKPANDVLPSPTGDLSASVSPATIKGCSPKLTLVLNVKIKTAKISSGGKIGFSQKFGPAKISRYMVLFVQPLIVTCHIMFLGTERSKYLFSDL